MSAAAEQERGISIQFKLVLSMTLAAVPLVLAFVAMASWALQWQWLVRLAPGQTPMVFNSALCVFACGSGIIAFKSGRVKLAGWLGVAVVLFALAIGLQYFLGSDFGIDRFFVAPLLSSSLLYPGRMAPNSVICFVCAGAALAALALPLRAETRETIAETLTWLSAAVANMAVLGYATGAQAGFGWAQSFNDMSAQTAVCFILLAAALVFAIWNERPGRMARLPVWVVVLMFEAVAAFDLLTPAGIAMGIAYIPLIIATYWFRRPWAPFKMAAFATVMALLGFVMSGSSDIPLEIAFANRGLSIAALWVVAVAVHYQRRAQRALAGSEERLDRAVTGAGLGLWQWDIERDTIRFNRQWAEILGYGSTETDIPVKEWVKLLPPDDFAAASTAMNQHLEGRAAQYEAEFRIRRPNGEDLWVMDRGKVMERDSKGLPLTAAGTHLDITARKESEAELAAAVEQLARSNTELEQFAYVASHDLQEPLRMVANFTGLFGKRYADIVDDKGKEYIRLACEASARMQQLISDLLAYARAGQREERYEEIDGNREFAKVLDILREPVETRNAAVTAGDLPKLRMSAVGFSQLLQNLVGNALKYTARDIRPRIQVSAVEQGEFWLFTVADNGIGIEDRYLERIFAPFKRLHGKGEYSGTGIGLAICRKVVEGHGGRIWAESVPGEGSRFLFTLPRKGIEAQPDTKETPS
jgi:PAS domain S-box-containing protein